jgi:phospholipase C
MAYLSKYLLASGRLNMTVDMGFCSTHVSCNRQARLILESDGHLEAANLLEAYSQDLDLGVCWPDGGWGSIHHFFHPKTGDGYLGMTSAKVMLERFFQRAVESWGKGGYEKAMFFLGAATHLVQDLCEPHHSNCTCRMDHHRYEIWVQSHCQEYLVVDYGSYEKQKRPSDWLQDCALTSHGLIDLVSGEPEEERYREATEILLPLTQRTTAGFWLSFLEQVGAIAGLKNVFYINWKKGIFTENRVAIAGK